MNSHPDFRSYFENVASKLKLLGREPGMVNLFFVEGPEMAHMMLVSVRNKLTLPCLMVEFYDEDNENSDARFQVLRSAFIVLDQAKKSSEGVGDVESAIYQRCKIGADQIFARMKNQSDKLQIKIDNKPTMISGSSPGNWVGPLANDLYGWRIEFTWRVAAGTCFDPQAWDD
ncbi:MAG: hypothetical protein ABIN80_23050 [Dyadobacter sp.]|uniref:hypothetical protein n=1 Tax=Dyadobacter sp. TaxID=1914288 RepID=UPI003264BB5F